MVVLVALVMYLTLIPARILMNISSFCWILPKSKWTFLNLSNQLESNSPRNGFTFGLLFLAFEHLFGNRQHSIFNNHIITVLPTDISKRPMMLPRLMSPLLINRELSSFIIFLLLSSIRCKFIYLTFRKSAVRQLTNFIKFVGLSPSWYLANFSFFKFDVWSTEYPKKKFSS